MLYHACKQHLITCGSFYIAIKLKYQLVKRARAAKYNSINKQPSRVNNVHIHKKKREFKHYIFIQTGSDPTAVSFSFLVSEIT